MTGICMDRIAATFNHHPNARQIKKLILAACTGTWENNPQQLAAFNFPALLEDLTQRYPTLTALKERLFKIVDALNKKEEYRGIADQILDQIGPEYLQQDLMGFPASEGLVSELSELPESESPTEPFAHESKLKADPPEQATPAGAAYLAPEVLISQVVTATQAELEQPEDWFDIRWEIMKFANPLSAKILLFSVVEYPFGFDQPDWLKLHDLTLDQLLTQLVAEHKSLNSIQANLQEMAIFLDQAMPAVHTAPHIGTTVSAIVQALQPLAKLVTPEKVTYAGQDLGAPSPLMARH